MARYSAFIYIILLSSSYADTVLLESGANRNTLVELYTSEGCSSCPPAEAYLNNFKNNKELWKKIIPVAFHVDYWDYIGWKDDFARKQFGQRQSLYASLKKASTVYTPAFMVNGSSWRRGIFSSSLPESKKSVGNLKVLIDGEDIQASYETKNNYTYPLKINVAVLAMNLLSKIEKGENAGRTAEHDFVVVGFKALVSNDLNWKTKLPKLHYFKAKKYALAVWVSDISNPTPIQVVGGMLPNYKN